MCSRLLCFVTLLFAWLMAKKNLARGSLRRFVQVILKISPNDLGFVRVRLWEESQRRRFRVLTVPDVGDACYSGNRAFFFLCMRCENTCFVSAERSKNESARGWTTNTHVHMQMRSFKLCESVQWGEAEFPHLPFIRTIQFGYMV